MRRRQFFGVSSLTVCVGASKFTFVPIPALFFNPWPGYDRQDLELYRALKLTNYYTPLPEEANFHIIPHNEPYLQGDELGGLQLFKWMERNYHQWNASVESGNANFILFHFCDIIVHCGYLGNGVGHNPAYSPDSLSRVVRHIVYNGLQDRQTMFFQAGKDVVFPVGRGNTCGPLCGSTIHDLRTLTVWNALHPGTLWEALQNVRHWPRRKHHVFWAGSITPAVSVENDHSGRLEFYSTFRNNPLFYVHQTYNWAADHATPLNVSILENMRDSTFCFVPMGSNGGPQDRYVAAVLVGCIPIMLRSVRLDGQSTLIAFPFEGLGSIVWEEFAVVVTIDEIPALEKILQTVNIKHKRAQLHLVWQKLLWTKVTGPLLGEGGEQDALTTFLDNLQ